MDSNKKNEKNPDFIGFNEKKGTFANYRTSRGFPLGGIGTGGFRIFTDGGIGEFRTNHNWFKGIKNPKGTFFGIWCNLGDKTKNNNKKIAKILRGGYRGGKEFKNIQNIQNTEFLGKFPRFHIDFKDDEIPPSIELEGFTPLIPQNIKDSSLPAGLLRFTIKNPMEKSIEIGLLYSFQNILGIGGTGGFSLLTPFDGPVKYNNRKGNYSEKFEFDKGLGISSKTNQNYSDPDPRNRVIGEYLSFVNLPENHDEIAKSAKFCMNWNSKKSICSIWNNFKENGMINEENMQSFVASNKKQNGDSAAFSIKFTLNPNETKIIDYYIIWWTPYYVLEKQQKLRKLIGHHHGKDYGHYYLNYFKNSLELAKYLVENRNRLYNESIELESILEKSTIPNWLTLYILNSTDSVTVNSVLTKEKKYYTIEGMDWSWPFGGLTGTNDQRLSSHPYSSIFFPELDKSEIVIFRDLAENGKVTHGNGNCDVALGTAEIPYGKPIKIVNRGKTEWVDLTESEILQLGKLIMITGDSKLLLESWDKLKEMIEYLDRVSIDNIPEGITTYDVMLYEPCFIYTATLYLASLRIMMYLADEVGKLKPENAEECIQLKELYQQRYDLAYKTMDSKLWNEKGFYRSCVGKDTLFTGGLAGDWIIRYAGLEHVLPIDKAFSHSEWQSKTINSHKFDLYGKKKTMPQPFMEATLEGNEVPVKIASIKSYHNNYIWQTLSYQAFEAIYLNRVEEGLKIIKMIFDKGYFEGYPYDMDLYGRKGFVYMTHPVMWAFFNAMTGVSLDALNNQITLSPRLVPGETQLRIPVFFPKCWLMISFDDSKNEAEIEVLKSFDPDFTINNIIYRKLDGTSNNIKQDPPFKVINQNKIKISLAESSNS